MALSNKTIKDLSIVLTPNVIDYIELDERYIEMMMEIIPEAISEALGSKDIDLVTEIAMCVMENITMRPRKTT